VDSLPDLLKIKRRLRGQICALAGILLSYDPQELVLISPRLSRPAASLRAVCS
jgi:hypothetical protein